MIVITVSATIGLKGSVTHSKSIRNCRSNVWFYAIALSDYSPMVPGAQAVEEPLA